MKTLVLLGNGFDLGHKLKTNFDDFINSLPLQYREKYSILKNGDNSWNEVELKFEELLREVMEQRSWQDLTEEVDRVIREYGLNDYGEVDFYGYTFEAYNDEFSEISDLILLLEDFERNFLSYLKQHCSDFELRKLIAKEELSNIISGAYRIITFNYTHTAEVLYGATNIIHIHGDIDDKIAIGSGALDEAKKSTIDYEYPTRDKFSKDKDGLAEMRAYYTEDMNGRWVEDHFVRRFFDEVAVAAEEKEDELFELLNVKSKDSLDERQDVIDLLRSEHYDKVYIVGHALGKADLNVFEAINKDAQVVYYYHKVEERDDREAILTELGFNVEMVSDEYLYL